MSDVNAKKPANVPAVLKPEAIDQLLAGINPSDLASPEAFRQLKKAILERALGAELTVHLGYPKGEVRPTGQGNQRNGTSRKRCSGPICNAMPIRTITSCMSSRMAAN